MDNARDLAVARPVIDGARAVFRGLVLVGHRRSVQAGHMFWALPGRGFADAVTLTQHDRHFHVISAPTEGELITLQATMEEVQQ